MANWLTKIIGRGVAVPKPSIEIGTFTEERSVLASTMDDADVFLRKMGLESLRVHVTAKNAMGIATFYACVKFISNQISSLPYNVYRYQEGSGSKKQTSHPLNYALETRLNKNMGPLVGKRAMILNCLVHGWSITEVKRDYNTRLTEQLIPYPSSQVFILHDKASDSYFFDIPHLNKRLSQDDVIFLKDLSFNGALGGSIISWQDQTIEIDLTAKSHTQKFFANRTFMGGFLEHPALANAKDETTAKKVKDRVNEALQDDELAVLPPGVNYKPLGLSPNDSRLLEIFGMSSKDICKIFNISPAMIGDPEVQSSWGSGVEAMYTILTNSVLVPIARQIEEEVDYKCLRADEILRGFYTKHNFKGLLRGDFKTQSEHLYRMVTGGIYMPDEARAYDDMAPLPKGTGARAYMNGTMTPLELIDEVKTQKRNGNKGSSAGAERGKGDQE